MTRSLAAQQATESELESLARQTQEAMATKNWVSAVRSLEKLVELAPNTAEVHGNLGLAYYSENRVFEAARAFERALKLNPEMTRAETMLGLCYAELGRNQEAVSILARAFRAPPDHEERRLIGLDLQRAYAGLQQYDKAIRVAEELLKRYPSDPEILFQSSRMHANRAYELMLQLTQSAPESVWSHYARADVHESMQHYDLAIAEYRKILELEPRMPGIHFRMGRAILQSSKEPNATDVALHQFELELGTSPENSDADYEIGEIYRRRNELALALEHFSRAVQHHPDFPQARIGLASILIARGRPREALGHLLEAVRIEPQSEVAHFRLASVYKGLGDIKNNQKEMALFQKLHSAGKHDWPLVSGASVASEVTQQTIEPTSRVPPQ